MKTGSVLLCFIFAFAFGVCAFLAFSHRSFFIGCIALIGFLIMAFETLRTAGAWADKKPWNGEGE